MRFLLQVLVFMTVLAPAAFAQGEIPQSAVDFFKNYIRQEYAHDTSITDNYSSKAVIKVKKIYAPETNMPSRDIQIPFSQYKTMVINAMPQIKAENNVNEYYDVKYAWEGNNIRIFATRFEILKSYSSPYSVLIQKNWLGSWKIIEETAESSAVAKDEQRPSGVKFTVD